MPPKPHTPIRWTERGWTDETGRRTLVWDGEDPGTGAALAVVLMADDDLGPGTFHWRYRIEIGGRVRAEGSVVARAYTAISVARGVMRNLVYHRTMYRLAQAAQTGMQTPHTENNP